MTGSVIAIVPVLLVFVFGNRAFNRGADHGSVRRAVRNRVYGCPVSCD